MHKIEYLDSAMKDLEEIKGFIAEDDPIQANVVVDAIVAFINVHLSIFPNIWKEVHKDYFLRMIVEKQFRYKVLYKFDGMVVKIYAIYKCKQDMFF